MVAVASRLGRALVFVVDAIQGLDSQAASAANLGCWMRTTSAAAAFSAIPRPQVRRWAMITQVIEVPSPLGLRPSGLEDAPDALRRAALHQRLGSPDAV